MKKFIVLTLLGASSLGAFAQGNLSFLNQLTATTFRSPVYGTVPSNASQSIVGQGTSALFFPTGSTSYQGAVPLSGSGFSMALFAGPTSVIDPTGLTFISQTTFRTGGAAGFINTTTVQVPGVQPGVAAKFQIRVWDNLGGQVTTWAAALLRDDVAKGTTPVVTTNPLGGTDSNGNLFPTNPETTGWSAFNIYAVPEPSTFVLAGLGAAGLLIFRRRK